MSTNKVTQLPAATSVNAPTSDFLLYIQYNGTTYDSKKILVSDLKKCYKTIFVPATNITPRSNNGCVVGSYESPTNKVHLETLDFDPSLAQYAQFSLIMPEDWDLSAIKVKFAWFADTGTGNTIWAIQSWAASNDDVIDGAFGTAVTATGTLTTLLDMQVTGATGAMTVAGTPALSDVVTFQIYRDATNGSDTLTGNARLLGVWIQYFASSTPAAW